MSSPAARRSEEEEEFGAGVLWTRQAAGEGALGTREEGRREQAEPRRGLGKEKETITGGIGGYSLCSKKKYKSYF